MIGAEINSEIDYEVLGVERGCRDFTVPPKATFDMEQSLPVAAAVVPATADAPQVPTRT
jgi:hypothetical protein